MTLLLIEFYMKIVLKLYANCIELKEEREKRYPKKKMQRQAKRHDRCEKKAK